MHAHSCTNCCLAKSSSAGVGKCGSNFVESKVGAVCWVCGALKRLYDGGNELQPGHAASKILHCFNAVAQQVGGAADTGTTNNKWSSSHHLYLKQCQLVLPRTFIHTHQLTGYLEHAWVALLPE